MASPIVIVLAGVPVGKGRPRFVRSTGHAFTPAKTRTYEAALRVAAGEAMAGRPPLEGPLTVEILAAFPVPQSWSGKRKQNALAQREFPTKKPDADNLLKALDAFNEIVFRDDSQMVRASIRKVYSEQARIMVTVEAMELGEALVEERAASIPTPLFAKRSA